MPPPQTAPIDLRDLLHGTRSRSLRAQQRLPAASYLP
jgi:hypothetical protein